MTTTTTTASGRRLNEQTNELGAKEEKHICFVFRFRRNLVVVVAVFFSRERSEMPPPFSLSHSSLDRPRSHHIESLRELSKAESSGVPYLSPDHAVATGATTHSLHFCSKHCPFSSPLSLSPLPPQSLPPRPHCSSSFKTQRHNQAFTCPPWLFPGKPPRACVRSKKQQPPPFRGRPLVAQDGAHLRAG